MKFKLKRIAGDASFREFYRVNKNKKNSIIVVSNKEKFKNLILYVVVNKILLQNKIHAPKLLSENIDKNFIEISDLGNKSLTNLVKNKKNIIFLYKKLIDLLIKIQKIKLKKKYIFKKKIIKFKKYSNLELHKESDLFFDWYLPNFVNKRKLTILKKKLRKKLNLIYKKLSFDNHIFVHRDFHLANFLVNKKNEIGIIDSQDAIIGNPLYDLTSLVDDVRVKIKKDIQEKLYNYYLKKTKIKKIALINMRNDYDILSVQRNLKILGIFVRLYKRDNKPHYLKYLPRTWELIVERMKNPIFKDFKIELEKHLSIQSMKRRGIK